MDAAEVVLWNRMIEAINAAGVGNYVRRFSGALGEDVDLFFEEMDAMEVSPTVRSRLLPGRLDGAAKSFLESRLTAGERTDYLLAKPLIKAQFRMSEGTKNNLVMQMFSRFQLSTEDPITYFNDKLRLAHLSKTDINTEEIRRTIIGGFVPKYSRIFNGNAQTATISEIERRIKDKMGVTKSVVSSVTLVNIHPSEKSDCKRALDDVCEEESKISALKKPITSMNTIREEIRPNKFQRNNYHQDRGYQ